MDQSLYWHIELYSGEIIKVKPNAAKIKYIQDLIAKQEGAITTPTRSIIVKDIKDFRLSDEHYSNQKLLESSSQAFNEPIITKDDTVQARWIKKSVPRRKWDTHYRFIPAYRLLNEGDSFVSMAFMLPTHQIDHQKHQELSQDEERQLSHG